MVEIDVAVFTFDGEQLLRLVNRAGERCSRKPAEQLLGRIGRGARAAPPRLEGATPRIEDVSFPGATGRWEMRRTTFRQEGRPHQLLVLADVSRPLRDEERQAWQRLIRVIGHEINNSLAPIKSIAGSLESMLARTAGNGSLSGRPAGRHEARPRRDRVALRCPQPVHDGLRAAGEAARAACSRPCASPSSSRARPASKRGSQSGSTPAPTSSSAPIPISSSSS